MTSSAQNPEWPKDWRPRASPARVELHHLLREWTVQLRAHFGSRLAAIVHFGSSSGETLKPRSDVDLIVVIDDLPEHRSQRYSSFAEWNEKLDTALTSLAAHGALLDASIHLRMPAEFDRPSRLYWDMLHRSEILFDPRGLAARQLLLTREWHGRGSARREERGLSWTWIFNDPKWMNLRSWHDVEGNAEDAPA